jgi:hypothetical protein
VAVSAAVSCEAVTVRSRTVVVNALDELTWSVYEAAFVTLLQSNATGCPAVTRALAAGATRDGAGRDARGSGLTVSVPVFVTPPPDADRVTVVGWEGLRVWMRTPACGEPAGMVTVGDMNATSGLLLVRLNVVSVVCSSAIAIRAVEPSPPVVVVRSIVHTSGGTPGRRVIGKDTSLPFQLAVIVTVVVVSTALVGMRNWPKKAPSARVTVAGGTASGELLVTATAAPPAGALPFKAICAGAGLPPVMEFGEGPSSFNDGGSTVIGTVAVDPAYVPVMTASVDAVT